MFMVLQLNYPNIIRGLASQDDTQREHATDSFWGGPLHQGTPTDCVPPSIPFLIELLGYKETKNKYGLLEIIAYSARFNSDKEFYEATSKGAKLYLGFLESEDDKIRALLPMLLARIRFDFPEVENILLKQIEKETYPKARISLVFALGFLAQKQQSSKILPKLLDIADDNTETPDVRLGALMGVIATLKQTTSENIIFHLVEIIKNHHQATAIFHDLYWGDSLVEIHVPEELDISSVLNYLELTQIRELLESLVLAVTHIHDTFYKHWYYSYMITIVFRGEKMPPSSYISNLSDTQIKVLVTIFDQAIENSNDSNKTYQRPWEHQYLLERVGIYTRSRDDLKAFLDGKRPANPNVRK